MNGLIAFLNARIDEDERYLNSNRHHLWIQRPLLEVATKRGLMAFALKNAAEIDGEWGDGHDAAEIAAGQCGDHGKEAADEILLLLAAVYSEHADYRAAWKPR